MFTDIVRVSPNGHRRSIQLAGDGLVSVSFLTLDAVTLRQKRKHSRILRLIKTHLFSHPTGAPAPPELVSTQKVIVNGLPSAVKIFAVLVIVSPSGDDSISPCSFSCYAGVLRE